MVMGPPPCAVTVAELVRVVPLNGLMLRGLSTAVMAPVRALTRSTRFPGRVPRRALMAPLLASVPLTSSSAVVVTAAPACPVSSMMPVLVLVSGPVTVSVAGNPVLLQQEAASTRRVPLLVTAPLMLLVVSPTVSSSPLLVSVPFTVRAWPLVVSEAPDAIVTSWTVTALVRDGSVLTAAMTASSAAPGTAAGVQFAAVFQSVLTLPFQVNVVPPGAGWALTRALPTVRTAYDARNARAITGSAAIAVAMAGRVATPRARGDATEPGPGGNDRRTVVVNVLGTGSRLFAWASSQFSAAVTLRPPAAWPANCVLALAFPGAARAGIACNGRRASAVATAMSPDAVRLWRRADADIFQPPRPGWSRRF